MIPRVLLGIAAASLLLTGGILIMRDPGDLPGNSEALVEAVRVGFADAYARGDVAALLDYYDRDYVDMSVGAAARGREDMRKAFEDTFGRYEGHLEISPDEVLVNGTWAIERGTFSIHSRDLVSGGETVSHRRYLEVLVRRDDGRWYIFRDLDNELPDQANP